MLQQSVNAAQEVFPSYLRGVQSTPAGLSVTLCWIEAGGQ